jgi:hypothetical protein
MYLQKRSKASAMLTLTLTAVFALRTFGVAQQYQQTNLVLDISWPRSNCGQPSP